MCPFDYLLNMHCSDIVFMMFPKMCLSYVEMNDKKSYRQFKLFISYLFDEKRPFQIFLFSISYT